MNDPKFWQKVDKSGDCWLWTGHRSSKDGYGRLSRWKITRAPLLAHRHSWTLRYGAIPDGLFVLHKCDVRSCVNPDHLFLGTARDNTHDMISKGRDSLFHPHFGEDHGNARLTDEAIRAIRALSAQGHSQRSIAYKFRTPQSNVWRIIHRLAWSHID